MELQEQLALDLERQSRNLGSGQLPDFHQPSDPTINQRTKNLLLVIIIAINSMARYIPGSGPRLRTT